MRTHEGRVAVVTGAARGIGQAVAAGLASRGASIVGVDLASADETGKRVQARGAEWLEIVADVSSSDDARRVADRTLARFDRCDILVNNAGIFPTCAFEDLTSEAWRRVFAVNLESQFLMSQALVPSMKARGDGAASSISRPVPSSSPPKTRPPTRRARWMS